MIVARTRRATSRPIASATSLAVSRSPSRYIDPSGRFIVPYAAAATPAASSAPSGASADAPASAAASERYDV